MVCRLKKKQKVITKIGLHFCVGVITEINRDRYCALSSVYDVLRICVEESLSVNGASRHGRWNQMRIGVIDDKNDIEDVRTCEFDEDVWKKIGNIVESVNMVPRLSKTSVRLRQDIIDLIRASRGFSLKAVKQQRMVDLW